MDGAHFFITAGIVHIVIRRNDIDMRRGPAVKVHVHFALNRVGGVELPHLMNRPPFGMQPEVDKSRDIVSRFPCFGHTVDIAGNIPGIHQMARIRHPAKNLGPGTGGFTAGIIPQVE